MYFRKSLLIITAGLLMFSVTACEISDTNINPNQATDTGINNLLAGAQVDLAYGIGGDISQYNSIIMQQMAGVARQHAQVGRYNMAVVSLVWDRNLYPGAMYNLHLLMDKAEEEQAWHHLGMAQVLMAYALGTVSSHWGDAPYSEAFGGTANPQPKYDTSQQLYDEVQSLLTSARTNLARPAPQNLSRVDFLYGGNTSRWIQAANALSARYHNHRSKVDPQGSANAVLAALNAGTFSSNADDMSLVFGSVPGNANPWFNHKTSSFDDTYMGKFLVDLLVSIDDPRLPQYAAPISGGSFVGQVAGVGSSAGISNLGPYYFRMNAPFHFITYSEVKFLEAEARFRLGQFDEAATAMNQAIIANLNKITGSADAAYVEAQASETGATMQAGGFQRLMTHKYVALFLQPEVFADWRRTGIPALSPAQDNVNGNQIPRRYPYPGREIANNSANVPSVTINSRLWWDTP